MTDYYLGIVVGALVGYCLSLFTMIAIWSLCVVAKQADEGRGYDYEKNTQDNQSQTKRT